MTNELQVFNYKGANVRTVEMNGEAWFIAKDVCDILELENVTEAIKPLEDDEKMTVAIIDSHCDNPWVSVINVSGLYALIFRSNKTEAKKLSKWIRSEVLPAIRYTSNKELEIKRRDLDLRGAQILQNMIEKQSFLMTPETQRVFAHEAFKLVTGRSYLAMLYTITEK